MGSLLSFKLLLTYCTVCYKLAMIIMLTIFDVSIEEKKVNGRLCFSLCFELLPQQMSQSKKIKRSTKTCVSMQISTSRSCWRPYFERLVVFGEKRM